MITASYIYQHLIKENKNDNNSSDIILLSLWVYVETLAIAFSRVKRCLDLNISGLCRFLVGS
ncbi:MAG TPA: hypothetical protein VIP70_09685 [Nitrososphaeraceae archaeon]